MAEGEQTCGRHMMEKVYVTGRKHKENTSSAFVSEGKRRTVQGWGVFLMRGHGSQCQGQGSQ